jgi:glutathione S-transferase
MKIYEFPIAPNARRVSIFLAEIGLEIERINVDIRGGENLTPEFKEKAANGLIPFLELDDGTCICESVAICRYLESIHGQQTPSLFGKNPLEIARIEMWHRMAEFQIMVPLLQAFRNISGIYKDRENINEQWGEESRQRFLDALSTFETQLGEQAFLAGERFTIADITLFSFINFARVIKFKLNDDTPNLLHWYTSMLRRPSIMNTQS